jgi:hypothetical protein
MTLAQINRALTARLGPGIELVRGKGYFYFAGPLTDRWPEAGVYGLTRLSEMPVEKWVAEAEHRLQANR